MREYPLSAVERAMKIQEVILQAMAKEITWWQAAEIIGISERRMRRRRQRYEEHGYDGLFDRRRGTDRRISERGPASARRRPVPALPRPLLPLLAKCREIEPEFVWRMRGFDVTVAGNRTFYRPPRKEYAECSTRAYLPLCFLEFRIFSALSR